MDVHTYTMKERLVQKALFHALFKKRSEELLICA